MTNGRPSATASFEDLDALVRPTRSARAHATFVKGSTWVLVASSAGSNGGVRLLVRG